MTMDNDEELVLDILKAVASSMNFSPEDAAKFYKESMDTYHKIFKSEE